MDRRPLPTRPGPDAYAPAQIAALVESVGVEKARLPLLQTVTLAGFITNLAVVTLGNIVGGSGFVALVYWV
jgi:formate/nitrite transporter FocA (FNT family)